MKRCLHKHEVAETVISEMTQCCNKGESRQSHENTGQVEGT
ncbi:hypothetical protein [Candidatus Regiella insecticola]|nr:hypothetical protein [Candidatus Regiella insecticola]